MLSVLECEIKSEWFRERNMKCCLTVRATRENFLSVTHFPLCLIYQHCPDILHGNFLLESIFLLCCYKLFLWLLVENRWPAILCKIRNTKIIAFEYKITLTRSSMVLTYSQDNWLCYLRVLQNSRSQNYKQKRLCDQTDSFIYFHFFPQNNAIYVAVKYVACMCTI